MKKLRTLYKKVKNRIGLTGRGKYKIKFFDELNEILGSRPATRPGILLDTLDVTETSSTLAAHDSPSMSDCQIADTDKLGESLEQSSDLDDKGEKIIMEIILDDHNGDHTRS